MVNRKPSTDIDHTASLTCIAPVVKRKRRASCLGEQERKERKRAIDREAQRSLREKTKSHIAELERTIEILRNQDRNGATASLLTEMDGLRAENERLRDVIDAVRNVIGGDILGRMAPTSTNSASAAGSRQEEASIASPPMDSAGQSAPQLRRQSTSYSQVTADVKQQHSSPSPDVTPTNAHFPSHQYDYSASISSSSRVVDLDGMSVHPAMLPPASANDCAIDLNLSLDNINTAGVQVNPLAPPDSPNTAAFAPFITEIFGPNWRCPSPLVLHVDNPPSTSTTVAPRACPIWRRTNELYSRISSCRPQAGVFSFYLDIHADWREAGLLFQGVKDGWQSFSNWKQSPVLQILKTVDEFLFAGSGRMTRLAALYKSFKLLKYYLNPSKEQLARVPVWLRPSQLQASTAHPIAVDMVAWPSLRDRLVHHHDRLFSDSKLANAYANYLHFEWSFSFEDAFYFDESVQGWYPSPVFEKYHGDVRCWTVNEAFWDGLEELRGDIEGYKMNSVHVYEV